MKTKSFVTKLCSKLLARKLFEVLKADQWYLFVNVFRQFDSSLLPSTTIVLDYYFLVFLVSGQIHFGELRKSGYIKPEHGSF